MKNLFKKILAVGLAATMTLGMAVTSFAEETCTCDPVVEGEGTHTNEECPLYVAPSVEKECTCEAAEGEDHAEDCPLYEAEEEPKDEDPAGEGEEEPVEAPVITFGSDKTDLAGGVLEDTYLWTSGSKKGTILDEDDKEATFDYSTLALNVAATAPAGGKVIVGTSATSVKTAPVTGGKFAKDTSGMAKASLKGNVLTLKPDKAEGDVIVWVAIIGKDKAVKASSYVDVTVRQAQARSLSPKLLK